MKTEPKTTTRSNQIGQQGAEEWNKSLPRFPKIMKGEKAVEALPNVRKDARRLENGEVVGRDLIETGIDVLNASVGAPLAKKPPLHQHRETTGVDAFLVFKERKHPASAPRQRWPKDTAKEL
jgi:hypothetical protein